ncbi:MAG: RagB/SusD family nutrient uptake outer membrane protein, partial [Muribaculaceae bacterium]|nr:RagB/SusD family nutrient uptake outer membrane protein [Muribaculaceae bacterium]
NKYFTGLMLGATLLSSCDMNETPENTIGLDNGLQSVAEVTAERDGLYSFLRSRCGGGYAVIPDLQSDLFIGTMQNGNSYLAMTTGNIQSDDSDIEGVWAGYYSAIVQLNYFLEKVPAFIEENDLTADELVTLNRYIAEAKFMRGYYYYNLANTYCATYNAATASNPATGMPMVLDFNPSGDRSTYPGRSTLQATFDQVNKDLTEAYDGLLAAETKDGSLNKYDGYLNSYAVAALQARVALSMADYQTAYDKAKSVVASKEFPLATGDDYYNMWIDDDGSELIFAPFGNSSQMASVPATGTIFNQANPVSVKFSPTSAIMQAYAANDIRLESFFTTFFVDYNGASLEVAAFMKYPGNPAFNSGNQNSYKNLPKPFRTSEQYLILAEAAYNLSNTADANKYLNELRAARIVGFQPVDYTGTTLLEQIKLERAKELCGEGFRISDLRRWKQGFTREANYTDLPDMDGYIINLGLITYAADSYKYVWPIPSYEMTTNPQLVGQQNPGY